MLLATDEALWLSDDFTIERIHLPSQTITSFSLPNYGDANKSTINIRRSAYLQDGTILVYTQKDLFVLDTQADMPQIKPLPPVEIKTIEDQSNFIHINFIRASKDLLYISTYRDLFLFNTQAGQLEWWGFDNTTRTL